MKKLVVFLILFVALPAVAARLVCDAPSADQEVTSYEVYINSVLAETVAAESDGSISYELTIEPGIYEFTAKACNVWGCGELSDPFQSPAAALKPAGLSLKPTE